MILIATAVLVAMAAGFLARRATSRTDVAVTAGLDLVLYVLLPVVAFAFASRLTFTVSTLAGLAAGYGVIAVVGLIAWALSSRFLNLTRPQQGAFVLCVVLANTGYFGLPVAATLLGSDELPQAVAWDQVISGPMAILVAPFIAGAFAGTHQDLDLGRRLLAVLRRAPALSALVLGLLVPGDWVPDVLFDVATVLVYATLPLGFFAVGATIQRLQGPGVVDASTPVGGIGEEAAQVGGGGVDAAGRRGDGGASAGLRGKGVETAGLLDNGVETASLRGEGVDADHPESSVGPVAEVARDDHAVGHPVHEVHPPRRAVVLAVGLRIVVAPLLYAAVTIALPDEPRAFMLQAAMPCGINALVVGHGFGLDRGLTSLAIASSTAIVLAGTLIGSFV